MVWSSSSWPSLSDPRRGSQRRKRHVACRPADRGWRRKLTRDAAAGHEKFPCVRQNPHPRAARSTCAACGVSTASTRCVIAIDEPARIAHILGDAGGPGRRVAGTQLAADRPGGRYVRPPESGLSGDVLDRRIVDRARRADGRSRHAHHVFARAALSAPRPLGPAVSGGGLPPAWHLPRSPPGLHRDRSAPPAVFDDDTKGQLRVSAATSTDYSPLSARWLAGPNNSGARYDTPGVPAASIGATAASRRLVMATRSVASLRRCARNCSPPENNRGGGGRSKRGTTHTA